MKLLIAISQLAFKGGAERVVLNIAKHMSKKHMVTILTANYDKNSTYKNFQKFDIKSMNVKSRFFPLKQILMLIKFSRLKLRDYDLINVHDFPATALSLRNKNVIWYCHTPPRLFHDLKDYELKKVNPLLRPLARCYVTAMQVIDKSLVKKIPMIIANSINVQARIKKFYNRTSKVIYPGVPVNENGKFRFKKILVSVSRLYPEKRVEMVAEAMKYLPGYKLFIVGEGPSRASIEKTITKNKLENVFLLGNVSEKKLRSLYRDCFAVIYMPIDEDFGLIPIEANSYGKMVIGVREGGLKETVIDGKTGLLIDNPTPKKIAQAIKKLEKIDPRTHVKTCIDHVKKFSLDNFNKRVEQAFIEFQRNSAVSSTAIRDANLLKKSH